MRYRDAPAFRQALEQRLKARVGGDGARLARDRKRVVFGRLLARLGAVAPGRWLLKGGFALDLRLAERARPTKDVDIEWRSGVDELLDTLIKAADHDAADFFAFTVERTSTPADRLGGSHRFRVSVALAERPFEAFLLDVGIRHDRGMPTETLLTEDLLSFAGIAPVEVEAVALELQVAEKLHAYTRTYEGARPSTRAKDLIDFVLIAELSPLDARVLRRAIEETFAQRESDLTPGNLPPPPMDWEVQFRRLAEEVSAPADLTAGHAAAAALLNPILGTEVTDGVWDPSEQRWRNDG